VTCTDGTAQKQIPVLPPPSPCPRTIAEAGIKRGHCSVAVMLTVDFYVRSMTRATPVQDKWGFVGTGTPTLQKSTVRSPWKAIVFRAKRQSESCPQNSHCMRSGERTSAAVSRLERRPWKAVVPETWTLRGFVNVPSGREDTPRQVAHAMHDGMRLALPSVGAIALARFNPFSGTLSMPYSLRVRVRARVRVRVRTGLGWRV